MSENQSIERAKVSWLLIYVLIGVLAILVSVVVTDVIETSNRERGHLPGGTLGYLALGFGTAIITGAFGGILGFFLGNSISGDRTSGTPREYFAVPVIGSAAAVFGWIVAYFVAETWMDQLLEKGMLPSLAGVGSGFLFLFVGKIAGKINLKEVSDFLQTIPGISSIFR